MKALLSILFVLFTAHSLQAKSLKAIRGQLINHTGYDFSEFRIELSLSCTRHTFVGDTGCGDKYQTVYFKKGGSFKSKTMSLSGFASAFRTFDVTAVLYHKDSELLYLNFETGKNTKHSFNDIYKVMRRMTVFDIPYHPVTISLKSGISFEQWKNEQSPDGLKVHYSIQTGKHTSIIKKAYNFSQGSMNGVFAIPGIYTSDHKFSVTMHLLMYGMIKLNEITGMASFNEAIPQFLSNIQIDDSAADNRSIYLTGNWKGTIKLRGKDSETGENIQTSLEVDGELRCQNGKLEGLLLDESVREIHIEGTCPTFNLSKDVQIKLSFDANDRSYTTTLNGVLSARRSGHMNHIMYNNREEKISLSADVFLRRY